MRFRNLMKSLSVGIGMIALATASVMARADVVTFGGLSGANGDPFTSAYTEGSFKVTPTTSDWLEGHVFGNLEPSIFNNIPSLSTIQLVHTSGGLFTFNSVDIASNNGTSQYTFTGKLGGSTVLTQAGIAPDSFNGSDFVFSTVNSTDTTTQIDELLITLNPNGGPTSFNVDNINISPANNNGNGAVPEPGSVALLLAGSLGAAGLLLRRKNRK